MNWLQALTLGGLTFGAKTVAIYLYMTSEVYKENAPIEYEPPQTTIVVPAFNEEAWIEPCLLSLLNQNLYQTYPDRFEILVIDSASTDATPQIAKKYADAVISAPRGKLTARHIGILDGIGELIVACDSDTFYPANWLNLTLRNFNENGVVAVSTPRTVTNYLLKTGYVWCAVRDYVLNNRIVGCSSAFWREAYVKTGGFNLNIDQFDRTQMLMEEEFAFAKRLKTVGKLKFEMKAPVITSARHFGCSETMPLHCMSAECQYCWELITKQRF